MAASGVPRGLQQHWEEVLGVDEATDVARAFERFATKDDLRALEERLASRLEERLTQHLEERLAPRLEERLASRLEERLTSRLEERLTQHLAERMDARFASFENRMKAAWRKDLLTQSGVLTALVAIVVAVLG